MLIESINTILRWIGENKSGKKGRILNLMNDNKKQEQEGLNQNNFK